jgi:2-polyprenyl-6-methoxyphenol hydroxylase-like FAD-dependent oxidoreductase
VTARRPLAIAVIGGGIGGQVAALYLMRSGFDVQIYEQSPQLTEAGAGLVVSPNASRLLIKLGLAAELQEIAVRPKGFHQRRWQDGRTLAFSRLADDTEQRYGAPLWVFHRGEMHQVLAQALPRERMHLGHRCMTVVDRGDHVEAQFENGIAIKADVLVGADGVHSTVRHRLLGPERPRFTGCIAYRGLIPMARLQHLNIEFANNNWMGPGRHFVHYPVSAGRMLNFVGLLEQDSWIKESWTEPGSLVDLAAAYAGFAAPVRGIIAAADHTFKWALLDRDPLPRWSFGRITLLGDACHPMLPFLGQGAAQAIEDGATLTACLERHVDDAPAALKLYETLRLPRATKCQTISRNNMARFHLPDGPAQQERDAKMATGTTDWSFEAIGWLYGHDASVLPQAASAPH